VAERGDVELLPRVREATERPAMTMEASGKGDAPHLAPGGTVPVN
jgi:hypothetical protein